MVFLICLVWYLHFFQGLTTGISWKVNLWKKLFCTAIVKIWSFQARTEDQAFVLFWLGRKVALAQLKASKFQKQILFFSFEQNPEWNYFLISALRISNGSDEKINVSIAWKKPLINMIKYFSETRAEFSSLFKWEQENSLLKFTYL